MMGTIAGPICYVLFVWWFSTGAILLLVGGEAHRKTSLKIGTALVFAASLAGLVATGEAVTTFNIYAGFACAILMWGAIEVTFLAGWITGPRPQACPASARGGDRLLYALQAIAYHELALISAGALALALTHEAANAIGPWTLLALLLLRQSAKVNLFLGVRTLNDELLPRPVAFLKSYFARGPINAFFPISVTSATAAAVLLAIAARSATSLESEVSLALLATLVALGALEHWFMVLPMPVADLWRWSVRADKPVSVIASPPPAVIARSAVARRSNPEPQGETGLLRFARNDDQNSRPVLSIVPASQPKQMAPKSNAACAARQRLEDQFRRDHHAALQRTALPCAKAPPLFANPTSEPNDHIADGRVQ